MLKRRDLTSGALHKLSESWSIHPSLRPLPPIRSKQRINDVPETCSRRIAGRHCRVLSLSLHHAPVRADAFIYCCTFRSGQRHRHPDESRLQEFNSGFPANLRTRQGATDQQSGMATPLDRLGMPHSEDLHLIERYRRTGKDTLELIITIDDPKTFTNRWDAKQIFRTAPADTTLAEYICENDHDAPSNR
jgi:hypothetical protein